MNLTMQEVVSRRDDMGMTQAETYQLDFCWRYVNGPPGRETAPRAAVRRRQFVGVERIQKIEWARNMALKFG
jgi:hypothetical protein